MLSMPKIALILPKLSQYGGVEQFGWRLAEALAKEGHAVDFICSRVDGAVPTGVQPVVVGRIGGFKVLKMLWFLVRAEQKRQEGQYDYVISLGKSLNQDLLRVGGGPQVEFWRMSLRAWPGFERNLKQLSRWLWPSNWLIRYIDHRQYHSGSRIVCVSDAVKSWVLKAYPHLSAQELEVIYNLPDVSRFKPAAPETKVSLRQKWGLLPERVGIVTATSNFKLKGTEALIKSLSYLPKHYSLFIAGGRKYHQLQALAHQLGVDVHFLGQVKDMPSLLQAMDIFVLPSFYDACSNAVLEALAVGLPVVSTSTNGSSYFLPATQIISEPDNNDQFPQVLAKYVLSAAPCTVASSKQVGDQDLKQDPVMVAGQGIGQGIAQEPNQVDQDLKQVYQDPKPGIAKPGLAKPGLAKEGIDKEGTVQVDLNLNSEVTQGLSAWVTLIQQALHDRS